MKRLVAVVVSALCVAAPAVAAPPLSVSTSVSPRWLYFADRVTAYVEVTFDPRRVEADSLSIQPSFAPWEEVAPTRTALAASGSIGHRSWRFELQCLSIDCLPRGTTVERFSLLALVVTATSRDGSHISVREPWPALEVAGRFLPAQTKGLRPVFRFVDVAPAPTFRADPSSLAVALDVLGAFLIAAALGFGAFVVARQRARRRGTEVIPPLVRALILLRQAERRDAADRRRAASLVGRSLPRGRAGLSEAAERLAWSPSDPEPGGLAALADAVEASLEADP
jgi:hypothetical protein